MINHDSSMIINKLNTEDDLNISALEATGNLSVQKVLRKKVEMSP